ncbi:MAG: tyrosine--tRNA ligase [Ardenticatenales bacterium]|nr:tyrosine--tRNA ligase [Ardenticatenales bacterium]
MRTIAERGLIHQCTDLAALDEAMGRGPQTAYIGFDLTAPSLHVGNLVNIMQLRRLQQAGHRPIALLGGGTTRIGDPSGKDEMRPVLDAAAIQANRDRIRGTFERLLDVDGPNGALILDNGEWLGALGYIDFLRDVGRHFTVNRLLALESIRSRLDREQALSFLEFNYAVVQAYDFVELFDRHGCTLQMGGSDQWGNITMGVDLARRMRGAELQGLTCPLLLTADGKKMGKTESGAVWLAADMLSPYDYWQYWRNCDDAQVGQLLRIFTERPTAEIDALAAREGRALNDAKIVLANEATALLHGEAAARDAAATASAVFAGGGAGGGLPEIEIPRADLEAGVPAFQLLVRAGLAESGSDARRVIAERGAAVNGVVVADAMTAVTLEDVGADGTIRLARGKKRHALVRPSPA